MPKQNPITLERPVDMGSAQRLAVLLFLAKRPLGALLPTIAVCTGMEADFCNTVCTALRADRRLRSENSGADTRWFVPIAGEDLRRQPTKRKAATA